MRRTALATVAIFNGLMTAAVAQTFGGYECTVDCSGHKAGYEWAESKGIIDEDQCEGILDTAPNRTSFYEGCMAYEKTRRAALMMTKIMIGTIATTATQIDPEPRPMPPRCFHIWLRLLSFQIWICGRTVQSEPTRWVYHAALARRIRRGFACQA
jgi:hypothetical protein